ncbi:MAG: glycosyltransferase family 4 protein [Gammaproteobacteria bacterium]|nr:glycosyltransferase family 4 protein [Gammaproteobacteria bacterium]
MKVLLIAEQANPEWVSVPLIGWSLSRAISRVVDAHIVTQMRNRDAFLRQGMIEGEQFTAIDSEYVAARANKVASFLRGGDGKGWTTVTAIQSLAYYAFEHELWKLFRHRIQSGEFSLVHRITPLSPTTPSILAKRLSRCGVPFFLGPLNGGLPWPSGFEDRRRAEGDWLSYLRFVYRLLPGRTSTLKHTSKIIAGSGATAAQIPKRYQSKVVRIAENGIDPQRFSKTRVRSASIPLIGVFVGRLVPYKCPDVLIRSAADLVRRGRLKLVFVGDGPMREELDEIALSLELADGVQFVGWMEHSLVQDILVESDFLALPSIREFGGGVVLEAMACGLPVVVANYGGPAELVEPGTGIKVDFNDAQSLEENLKNALVFLTENPTILDSMSIQARDHILAHFTWAAKARDIVALYSGGSASGPAQR